MGGLSRYPQLKGTVRAIGDAETNENGELTDAAQSFNREVATHTERLKAVERQLTALGDVGAAKTIKAQKLSAICLFVQNKRGCQSTVAVTAEKIQGCVGVSRRYAYDLIEIAAEELDGGRVHEATDARTNTEVECKKKALLVNCEVVH